MRKSTKFRFEFGSSAFWFEISGGSWVKENNGSGWANVGLYAQPIEIRPIQQSPNAHIKSMRVPKTYDADVTADEISNKLGMSLPRVNAEFEDFLTELKRNLRNHCR